MIDAIIYAFIDHDVPMAVLAGISAVTMGASSILKAAKEGSILGKTAKYLLTVSDLVSNGASGMYEKYVVQGQSFASGTAGEFATLGLSVLGCVISGKGVSDETKELAQMMRQDRIASRLSKSIKNGMEKVKGSLKELVQDNRGCVDLSFFGMKSGLNSVDDIIKGVENDMPPVK